LQDKGGMQSRVGDSRCARWGGGGAMYGIFASRLHPARRNNIKIGTNRM
jgi:hypothetical protein